MVHDLLGGDLIPADVYEHGMPTGHHYWNRLPDGREVDLTREQFRPGETIGAGRVVHVPPDAPKRCRGQYALLRYRVRARFNGADAGDSGESAATRTLIRLAGVLLVGDADAIPLLQQRDRDAPVEPGQWSLPSGPVEAGEDPERAGFSRSRTSRISI